MAMALGDSIRRFFATRGTNPPFKKDEPRSFGEGVIRRLQLNKKGMYSKMTGQYEPQIGNYRRYMDVYLSDPLVRTLIDLPCLYAVKDGYEIVTDDKEKREELKKLFDDINIEMIIYSWLNYN